MPFFMMNREDLIYKFVFDELSKDNSGHDHLHVMRVVKNARMILKTENGDENVIITACYLHDCIDKKLFEDITLQEKKVICLLQSLQYEEKEIEEVLYIMNNISFSSGKSTGLTNRNAQIVCDADRLDAIGAIGIIRTIEYGASRGRKFYHSDEIEKGSDCYSKETTIAHFYEKLLLLKDLMFTETAKQLAEQRTQFMKDFLNEFYNEIQSPSL